MKAKILVTLLVGSVLVFLTSTARAITVDILTPALSPFGEVAIDSTSFPSQLFEVQFTGDPGERILSAEPTTGFHDGFKFSLLGFRFHSGATGSGGEALFSISFAPTESRNYDVTLPLIHMQWAYEVCGQDPTNEGCSADGPRFDQDILVQLSGVGIAPSPVPIHPSPAAQFIIGLALLGLIAWRRKRKGAAAIAA